MNTAVKKKVDEFFGEYPLHEYKKGQIIVHGGEDPPGIFYLIDGTVRQYDITYSGNQVVVNVFKPGSFFPMSWAMNKTPNDYYFETASKASLRVAPVNETVKFVEANPDVAFDLLKRVYSGLDGILSRLKHSMKGNARSKTILELVIESKRFGKISDTGTTISVSEEEFANRAGLSRETVSRELTQLQKQGLIDVNYGKILIKDVDELEGKLEGSL